MANYDSLAKESQLVVYHQVVCLLFQFQVLFNLWMAKYVFTIFDLMIIIMHMDYYLPQSPPSPHAYSFFFVCV